MKINWKILNRKIHYWGSIACALPVIIIIITGMLLLFKKQSDWIQPSSMRGESKVPTIQFEEILDAAKSVEAANIDSWKKHS
ncbi:PepSY-associated TM helix domain-containing protein [Rickettsiales bacterium]|nr:PepSY-associated TM helix domain-containing protein [Rickettsiales bacterium]